MDNFDASKLAEIAEIADRTAQILASVQNADGIPDEDQLAAINDARACIDVVMANAVAIALHLTAASSLVIPELPE